MKVGIVLFKKSNFCDFVFFFVLSEYVYSLCAKDSSGICCTSVSLTAAQLLSVCNLK